MLTYPEMNGKIVSILKLDAGDPTALYAAARIEALETALRRVVGATDKYLRWQTDDNEANLWRELSNAELELSFLTRPAAKGV